MTGAAQQAQQAQQAQHRVSRGLAENRSQVPRNERFHRAARVRRRVCRSELRMRAIIMIHSRKRQSHLRPRRRRLESFACRQGTPDPGDCPCLCPRGLAESKALRGFASAQDPEWGVVTSYGCLIQFQAMNRPPNRRADQAFSAHGTDEARRRPRALKAGFRRLQKQQGPPRCPKPQLAWCLLR